MEQSKTLRADANEFRGFGRSDFWPFRGRLKSIAVADDFADVRRSLRDCCPVRSGVYGMVDSRDRLIYVGMSAAIAASFSTRWQFRFRRGSAGAPNRYQMVSVASG